MKVKLLGTGDPLGMPVMGCKCEYCKETEGRNRPCVYIEDKSSSLVLDTPPDLKRAINSEGLKIPDYFFITHFHFDHFWGIPEIDQLSFLKDEPNFEVYLDQTAFENVKENISWLSIDENIFENQEIIQAGEMHVSPFNVEHSDFMETYGFKISKGKKKIVYLPDFREISQETKERIKGADLLIIDGQYILGKYIEDEDHKGGEELQKDIKSLEANEVRLIAVSEHFYEMNEEEIENKIPNEFEIGKDGEEIII